VCREFHRAQVGAGPPVVLTHGLGDDSGTWAGIPEILARQHTVLSWDLPGHGRSAPPDLDNPYSWKEAVADLLDLVLELGPPVLLVGHSLGGYLSLRLTLEQPELVRSLVMISSGPGFRDADARRRWNDWVDRAAARMGVPPDLARVAHHSDAWVIDHLPNLARPTLVIVGENDTRFQAGAEYMVRTSAACMLEVIPRAGHHPQRSSPATVAHLIDRHADTPQGRH
jgi:pimeloyl-ACP methyl ester carboxylesterase